MSQSEAEFARLLETLGEVGRRFAGDEWGITAPDDRAEALAAILHNLAMGWETQFENDPAAPAFKPMVLPWRKALGDNADALYFDAPVDPGGVYRITGRMDGAVYCSFTVERGIADGSFPTGLGAVLNDTEFDIAPDGSFEIIAGGAPPDDERNHLVLADDSIRITVRAYWEDKAPPASIPGRGPALDIELLSGDVPGRPRAPSDASIALDIARMSTYMRSRTVDLIAPPGQADPVNFVSRVPHEFPQPVQPDGGMANAAKDAAYSMAPYLLNPDEALVITARWPECRCANVNLWNRHMQTFDYLRHSTALNRTQAHLEPDGSLRVIVAHEDPGTPNWLDTEGRPFGLVFWRFMLPEGEIERPSAEVVPLSSLSG